MVVCRWLKLMMSFVDSGKSGGWFSELAGNLEVYSFLMSKRQTKA